MLIQQHHHQQQLQQQQQQQQHQHQQAIVSTINRFHVVSCINIFANKLKTANVGSQISSSKYSINNILSLVTLM